MKVHYVEFVCGDVDAQCAVLEASLGLSFGPPVAELGNARVAPAQNGTSVGVRAPLADHEEPIIRTYTAVGDIAQAVAEAESRGALVAYPPTEQGDTGTWAICVMGGVQVGFWQK